MSERIPAKIPGGSGKAQPVSLTEMIEEAYGRAEATFREREVALFIDHLSSTAGFLWADREAHVEVLAQLLERGAEDLYRGGVLVYIETAFAPGRDMGELTLLMEAYDAALVEGGSLVSSGLEDWRQRSGGEPLEGIVWAQLVEGFALLGGDLRSCGHATRFLCVAASLPVIRYGLEEWPRPLLNGEIERKHFKVLSGNPFVRAVVSEQLEKFGLLSLEEQPGEPALVILSGPFEGAGVSEAETDALFAIVERPAGLILGNLGSDESCLAGCSPVARLAAPLFKYQLLGAVNSLLHRRTDD